MRLVVQRVKSSKVEVHFGSKETEMTRTMGSIPEGGLAVLVGFTQGDNKKTCLAMAKKLVGLRLFDSTADNVNDAKSWAENVVQKQLKILLVSQFTLLAKLKGTRPDFHMALNPNEARELYYYFVQEVRVQYAALATAIKHHPVNKLPKSRPVYDYSTFDPLIQTHFEDEVKLPVEQRHGVESSMGDVKGLEMFSFDEFVHTTQFGSYMSFHIINDGPVTLILESPPEVQSTANKTPAGGAKSKAVQVENPVEIDVSIESSQPITESTLENLIKAIE